MLLAFNMETFTLDIWGQGNTELGSVMDQVKSTMKVTLWVFIGIEGPWWSPPVPVIARM